CRSGSLRAVTDRTVLLVQRESALRRSTGRRRRSGSPSASHAGRVGRQLVERREVLAHHIDDSLTRVRRRVAPVGAANRTRHRNGLVRRRRRVETLARFAQPLLPRYALVWCEEVRSDVLLRHDLTGKRGRCGGERLRRPCLLTRYVTLRYCPLFDW